MARPDDAPTDTESPLADPALRLAARTIDLGASAVPLVLLTGLGVVTRSPTILHAGVASFFVAASGVLALNLYWLHRYGQTLGKRVVGVRIVRASGERAGLGRIVVRRMALPFLLAILPLLGPLFALTDALMIFTASRQTLHDRFADTIVVDLRREPR